MQLPAYDDTGEDGAPNRTAAQSEVRALDGHSFFMLARDGAGVGAEGGAPIVYKKILLVDLAGAVLQDGATPALRSDIVPALTGELVDMLDPVQLARVGLTVERLSEK